ncbi:MAG: acyltransferase family protein [Acutalibacteraceae bacterium]|nr:acyltransferase family protein [Acutalibacteraceae bacterium]
MTKRLEKWDILKFILIFLVVLGHFIDASKPLLNEYDKFKMAFFFIYSFHMPLFIFVSGLFSKKTINEKRYDKMFSYFLIYFWTKVIIMFARCISTGKLTFSLFNEMGLPWYALVIFIYCILTVFLKRFSKAYVMIFLLVLGCLAGLDSNISDFLAIARCIVFFPFFYLGYCLDITKLTEFLNKPIVRVISAIVLIGFVIGIFCYIDEIYQLRVLFTARNPYSKLGEWSKYGILLRVLCYLLATVVGVAVMSVTPSKIGNGNIFSRLGSRTLQVYMLHYIFVYVIFTGIGLDKKIIAFFPDYPEIIILILSLAVTLFCSLKIFEKPINALIYPKPSK